MEVAEKKYQGEVMREMEQLDNDISNLASEIESLRGNLGPILRNVPEGPEQNEPSKQGETPSPSTDLGKAIRKCRDRIWDLRGQIEKIQGRSEV